MTQEMNLAIKAPIGVDLFCGAGGMSLGFEQAGFEIKAAVEIDSIHALVHKFNFPNCNIICEDISQLAGADIITESVDVVFGGPPCQGFSLIGKRNSEDPRNNLVMQFMRVVSEIKPKYFVMENVAGLTIGSAKQVLDNAIGFIKTKGYSIVEPYKILNSQDYGVPQARRRLILFGYRNDQRAPEYPQEQKAQKVTVGDALCDLPDIDLFPQLAITDEIDYSLSPRSEYAKRLHNPFLDEKDFSTPRVWKEDVLTGSMRTLHTEESIIRFASTEQGEVEKISRFLKLNLNGVCNTLRAGTDKSRGAYTSPRPIHPIYNRCISVREAQRLHSYPDWFRMHSTKWHGFREVGNSVPPLFARAVASCVINALAYTPKKLTTPILMGNPEWLTLNTTQAKKLFEKGAII